MRVINDANNFFCTYENNGWKVPSIGFNDAFGKLFKKEYKEWRYNNMNFTIGISYPF